MENSVTGVMAGLWHWQLANDNDALKKHCVRRLINTAKPSLIIHDRREKRKEREEKGKREHSVTRYIVKPKVPYN